MNMVVTVNVSQMSSDDNVINVLPEHMDFHPMVARRVTVTASDQKTIIAI
jgi:hypothetical protein